MIGDGSTLIERVCTCPSRGGFVWSIACRPGRDGAGNLAPSALIRAVVYSAEGLSTVMCSVSEGWWVGVAPSWVSNAVKLRSEI